MLPLKNRLKKIKDFERVFKEGKGLKSSFFYIKFSPNKLKDSRFGIVVSKKISKKATERNNFKRKIRESVKKNFSEVKEGQDYIIILISPPLENNFETINKNLINVFKKINNIK